MDDPILPPPPAEFLPPPPRKMRLLHFAAAVLADVCLAAALFTSTYGGRALGELYGPAVPVFWPTAAAVAAWHWLAPITGIFTLLLILAGMRGYRANWLPVLAIVWAALSLAIVAVGITLPFASTTVKLAPQ